MFRPFLFVFLYCLSLPVFADHNRIPKAIHSICKTDPVECLTSAPDVYPLLHSNSTAWFKLRTYEIQANYTLSRIEQLLALTKSEVDNLDSPKEFQFIVNYYHAKGLLWIEDREGGDTYLNKAKRLYTELKTKKQDPKLMALYGNLLLVEAHRVAADASPEVARAKYIETQKALLAINKKVHQMRDPYIQLQINTDLAHVYFSLGNYQKQLLHYKKAEFWSRQTGDIQSLGVDIYNVARTYQRLTHYDRAIAEFKRALATFVEAKDSVSIVDCHLRMAEIYLTQDDMTNAKHMLDKLASFTTGFGQFQIDLYKKLQQVYAEKL